MEIVKRKCVPFDAPGRALGERKLCKFYLHNIIAWYNRYVKSEIFHENSLSFSFDGTLKYVDFAGFFNFDDFVTEPRFDFVLSLD
uniref:hypothetical protein n=1 Tax=Limosilactobacillus reuteri TaxID=1598 RepID=UPI003D80FA6F